MTAIGAAGVLTARDTGGLDGPRERVRLGAVADVTLSRAWDAPPAPLGLPGLTASPVLARTSGDGAVIVALARRVAPDLLPAALREALSRPAGAGLRVRFAGLPGLHYADLAIQGVPGRTSLYVTPTDRGALTVACTGDLAGRACDAVAASLRVRAARPVALGPDPAEARALDETLTGMQAATERLRSELATARDDTARRAALDGLERTYTGAANRVAGLEPWPQWRQPTHRVETALRDTADAYRSASAAVGRSDVAKYAGAARRVRAGERALAGALDRLRQDGWRLR